MQNRFDSAFNAISGALTEEQFIRWYNKYLVPYLDDPKKALSIVESKAAKVVSWWLKPIEDHDSAD
jgi:hypothetical protein